MLPFAIMFYTVEGCLDVPPVEPEECLCRFFRSTSPLDPLRPQYQIQSVYREGFPSEEQGVQ
jgi:hypothetical protein